MIIVPEDDANRLRLHAENALGGAYDPSQVLPILHRLAKHAEVGSDDALFAHLRLAELLVAKSPWRASIHARKVLALHPGDDRAWAILGLSQALLGHYRFARVAYEGAVRAAPENPYYAHNLGHLIDVALDSPREALPWLRRARALAPHHLDVVTSLAHALARLGDFTEARSLLAPVRRLLVGKTARTGSAAVSARSGGLSVRGGAASVPELVRLIRWVDRESGPQNRNTGAHKRVRERPPAARNSNRARKPGSRGVQEILAGGVAHLPFSPKQLARTRTLAKHVRARVAEADLVVPPGRLGGLANLDPTALAAAIAYAIIYVDQVPLSAGEVAAPFRVSATRVRAAFEVLRGELDLIRGDARYATECS